jgi:hypothetical protein
VNYTIYLTIGTTAPVGETKVRLVKVNEQTTRDTIVLRSHSNIMTFIHEYSRDGQRPRVAINKRAIEEYVNSLIYTLLDLVNIGDSPCTLIIQETHASISIAKEMGDIINSMDSGLNISGKIRMFVRNTVEIADGDVLNVVEVSQVGHEDRIPEAITPKEPEKVQEDKDSNDSDDEDDDYDINDEDDDEDDDDTDINDVDDDEDEDDDEFPDIDVNEYIDDDDWEDWDEDDDDDSSIKIEASDAIDKKRFRRSIKKHGIIVYKGRRGREIFDHDRSEFKEVLKRLYPGDEKFMKRFRKKVLKRIMWNVMIPKKKFEKIMEHRKKQEKPKQARKRSKHKNAGYAHMSAFYDPTK